MTLDPFGKIAAAEIAFYAPVLCIAFFVALRHGFSRRQGWVFLFIFSLIRVVGSAITLSYRTSSEPKIGLIIAATVLSGIGLSPLLLATHVFVRKIAEYGWQSNSNRPLHMIRVLLVVSPILGAVGGSMVTPGDSESSINTGRTLTRVAVVLFMVAFAGLFAVHILLWRARLLIPVHHLTLLFGISLTMPPLFIRLVYSLLGAFATSIASRWSYINGDWRIYLTMGLIMEYLVVGVYITTGLLTPLQKEDKELNDMGGSTQAPNSSVGQEVV
ncbi:hypothetical protein BU17DRAFT_40796 [Hysterangium stoloniferum]|nr:hypothetical protein BU17DRAFT_40796 [Hysterangium stoloniferum]